MNNQAKSFFSQMYKFKNRNY